MGGLVLILVLTILGIFFLMGNYMIIDAAFGGYAIDWSEEWSVILLTIILDFILLFFVLKKIKASVIPSFQLMRSGLKNRKIAKKESAKLEELIEKEKLYVNRLQELREKGISESATKRTLHFCQLIEAIAGKDNLQACLSEVGERQGVLDEIDDIESRIFKIAESYKNVGDTEKCKYYLDILKSTNKITPEITALENECEALLYSRVEESKVIRLWRGIFLGALTFLIVVSVEFYIEDTPYRNLRSMIKNQSLTAEMCSRANRKSKDSFYDYLTSEKGRKLLASELTKLHKNYDTSKAMWLLCIQPNEINGFELWASKSFIQWLIGYAKNNGVRSTDQDGPDDRSYNVTYSVNGYQIIMDWYNDKKSNFNDITVFSVSDGENRITIHNWSRYKDTIPAIE